MKKYFILLAFLFGAVVMTAQAQNGRVPNFRNRPVYTNCDVPAKAAGLSSTNPAFNYACNELTKCFNHCNIFPRDCTTRFYGDLFSACNGDPACIEQASLMSVAMDNSEAGRRAYEKQQEKACTDCKSIFGFDEPAIIVPKCDDEPAKVRLNPYIDPTILEKTSATFHLANGTNVRRNLNPSQLVVNDSDPGDYSLTLDFYDQVSNKSYSCVANTVVLFQKINCLTPEKEWEIPLRASQDPNDIIGPEGYGKSKMVSNRIEQPYTIRFENDSNFATAPAQIVRITHPLDKNVNPLSIRLGNFGFGKHVFNVPPDRTFYTTRLDMVTDLGVVVDLIAGINTETREAFWILESRDPQTELPPTDAMLGFLPINDKDHSGEGFVSYTIKAADNTVTGDTVHAKASIVFDVNAPIETPAIFNTLDAGDPVSSMKPLPATAEGAVLKLEWTGADDTDGSGIKHYDLYMSKDNGPFLIFKENITENSFDFKEAGGHYKFFVIATDNVGHREAHKTVAEASVEWHPTLSCPANKTVDPGEGVCTAVVNDIDPDTDGLPTGVSVTYHLTGATTGSGSGSASGQVFNQGVTAVTYSTNTNPAMTCSFTVTVNTRAEICNNQIDDDCDGQVDEGCPGGAVLWYRDTDNDGFGDINHTVLAVSKPDGYVSNATDCNDGDPAIHPGATEICNNNIDDDCDGTVDEDCPVNLPIWYRDHDNDTYGDPNNTTRAATKPDGFVADNTDCNDNNLNIHPGATEVCGNNQDDDCDGTADEGCPQLKTWYLDNDKDGYGDESHFVTAADQPAGYVATKGDCNDNNKQIHPGATEVCDGVDNNCDGRGDDCAPGLYARAAPNPSKTSFKITMTSDTQEQVVITIRNANGKVMDIYRVLPGATLDVGNRYVFGMYYAEVVQGSKRTVLKLMKLP